MSEYVVIARDELRQAVDALVMLRERRELSAKGLSEAIMHLLDAQTIVTMVREGRGNE